MSGLSSPTDAVVLPAGIVDKSGEDKLGILIGGRFRRDNDKDDGEGKEGSPECQLTHGWKDTAIAIEEEGEDINRLIAEENMPWSNHTVTISGKDISQVDDM